MLTTQMRAARKLNSSNRNDESNYQTMSTTFGTVLFDNIMQVIDSIGNSNYTFKVLHDETSDTKFFNLVMSEKEEGVKVSLIKYEMNETFALLYKQGELDLSQFSGTVTTYTLTNPCMCELPDDGVPVLVTPGDSAGGGGDGGTGFGDPTGPSGGSNPSSGGTNVGCGLAIINTICCTGTHSGYNPSCLCANYGELPGSTFLVDTCTGEVLFQYNRNKGNNKENQNQTETYNQNNCCNDGIIGVLDGSYDTHRDNCKQLKELSNVSKQNINSSIQTLKDKVIQNVTDEWGVEFIKSSSGYSNNLVQGTSNQVALGVSNEHLGGAHIHTKKGYKIFSWGDLYFLSLAHNNASLFFKDDVTYILVVENPTDHANPNVFALKVDDIVKLNQKLTNDLNNPTYNITVADSTINMKIDKIHKKLAKSYEANKTNLEHYFLTKFKDYGISTYQASNNLDSWGQLEATVLPNNVKYVNHKACL